MLPVGVVLPVRMLASSPSLLADAALRIPVSAAPPAVVAVTAAVYYNYQSLPLSS